MSESDEVNLVITCSNCGKEVKESMTWFMDHCSFSCPHCSMVFNIGEKKITMALNNFEHSIRNHGF